MKPKKLKKLEQLFNRFAQEEQASSFAVNNLLNQTIRIINESDNIKDKEG